MIHIDWSIRSTQLTPTWSNFESCFSPRNSKLNPTGGGRFLFNRIPPLWFITVWTGLSITVWTGRSATDTVKGWGSVRWGVMGIPLLNIFHDFLTFLVLHPCISSFYYTKILPRNQEIMGTSLKIVCMAVRPSICKNASIVYLTFRFLKLWNFENSKLELLIAWDFVILKFRNGTVFESMKSRRWGPERDSFCSNKIYKGLDMNFDQNTWNENMVNQTNFSIFK